MRLVLVIIMLNHAKFINSIPRILASSVMDSESARVKNGIILLTKKAHDIELFGINLTDLKSGSLTEKRLDFGSDCNDIKIPRIFPLKFNNDRKTLILTLTRCHLLKNKNKLYLCVSFEDDQTPGNIKWIHQGDKISFINENPPIVLPLWLSISMVIILTLLSGVFSGLNIGLISLSIRQLKLIRSSGSDSDKRLARRVLPLRKKENILLCAILFSSTVLNSFSAAIIDSMTTIYISIIISTIIIVLVAEIIPQSICSRYGLQVSGHVSFIVWFALIVTFPLSYPLGKLLNYILKNETPKFYNRQQLLEVFKLNRDGNLDSDEFEIILGGLKLKTTKAVDIMRPLDKCFMIDENAILDFKTLSDIINSGFSRIPVYRGDTKNTIGIIHSKDLYMVNTDECASIKEILSIHEYNLIKVTKYTTVYHILKEFKKGSSHLSIVVDSTTNPDGSILYQTIGIVTLHDVIGQVIKINIPDGKDLHKEEIKNIYGHNNDSQSNAHVISINDKITETNTLTENMAECLCNFMSKSIKSFKPKYILTSILKKVIMQRDVAITLLPEIGHEFLFKKDVPADYFVLIIKGRVEVCMGTDNYVFYKGAMSYFGHSCLIGESKLNSRLSRENELEMFIPDFTVKIIEPVFVLKISVSIYIISLKLTKATLLAKKKLPAWSENTSVMNMNKSELKNSKILDIENRENSIKKSFSYNFI